LWQAQVRRGELIDSASERQVDVARLVHGYGLGEGAGFHVGGAETAGRQELAAVFIPRELGSSKDIDGEDEDGDSEAAVAPELLPPLSLQLEWSNPSEAAGCH